jgi:hypothetical protein
MLFTIVAKQLIVTVSLFATFLPHIQVKGLMISEYRSFSTSLVTPCLQFPSTLRQVIAWSHLVLKLSTAEELQGLGVS